MAGKYMVELLISRIKDMTNLPEDFVRNEIVSVVKLAGLNPQTITLEELRGVLADYLQDVLVDTKNDLSGSIDSNC